VKTHTVELTKRESYYFTICLFNFGGHNDTKMKLVHTFSFSRVTVQRMKNFVISRICKAFVVDLSIYRTYLGIFIVVTTLFKSGLRAPLPFYFPHIIFIAKRINILETLAWFESSAALFTVVAIVFAPSVEFNHH